MEARAPELTQEGWRMEARVPELMPEGTECGHRPPELTPKGRWMDARAPLPPHLSKDRGFGWAEPNALVKPKQEMNDAHRREEETESV